MHRDIRNTYTIFIGKERKRPLRILVLLEQLIFYWTVGSGMGECKLD
jgi:hypothetical protein